MWKDGMKDQFIQFARQINIEIDSKPSPAQTSFSSDGLFTCLSAQTQGEGARLGSWLWADESNLSVSVESYILSLYLNMWFINTVQWKEVLLTNLS